MLVSTCPSLPCSGVYAVFTVFHLGRLATTHMLRPLALEGASRHQPAAHLNVSSRLVCEIEDHRRRT